MGWHDGKAGRSGAGIMVRYPMYLSSNKSALDLHIVRLTVNHRDCESGLINRWARQTLHRPDEGMLRDQKHIYTTLDMRGHHQRAWTWEGVCLIISMPKTPNLPTFPPMEGLTLSTAEAEWKASRLFQLPANMPWSKLNSACAS
jgi:hypothetical protein